MRLRENLNINQLFLVLSACALGCVACFYLQKFFVIPGFLASAGVGLVGSFLPHSRYYNNRQLIACIYTGSFSAMCSLSYFTWSLDVYLLSLFTGIYFLLVSPYFKGIGGKLGTISFLSSLSFLFAKGIF